MSEDYAKDEFVTVFASRSRSAEVEAASIHALLESAGLNSLIVRENVPELPTGRVSVKVLASDLEDAEGLIQAARKVSSAEEDGETEESSG